MDREPAPLPPRLCRPELSHWNMPFEKCLHFLSVAGQVPATLMESGKRRGGRRGKVRVIDGSKRGRGTASQELSMQSKHHGPCQIRLPRALTGPRAAPQTLASHPGPEPNGGTPRTRGPTCPAGATRPVPLGSPAPRTPSESPVKLGTSPANSKPLKSVFIFYRPWLKGPSHCESWLPLLICNFQTP